MSLSDDVKTALQADTALMPILTGSVHNDVEETSLVNTPSAFDTITSSTSAGWRALGTSTWRSSLQRTISIRSPPSSSTMFLIRLPRTPTHAPTQSTRESELLTATLLR